MKNPFRYSIWLLILCIAIPLIVGFLGSSFTIQEIPGWYTGLIKPWFNPPAWIFGPVWTFLYILMGISLWLIIKDGVEDPLNKKGVLLFVFQLIANFAWSIIFFGMHNIFGAFIEILILLILIAWTFIIFKQINKIAGWLLLPYLCWTGFATILTGTIWLLNG